MDASRRGETGRPKRKKASRETLFFYCIIVFIGVGWCIEVALFNDVENPNIRQGVVQLQVPQRPVQYDPPKIRQGPKSPAKEIRLPEHLLPRIPILPLFNSIQDPADHISNLLNGRPSMAGVVALLQKFISDLHGNNMKASKAKAGGQAVLDTFYRLTEKHIKPFDDAYHGKHIFPLREDGSIFISLAAFREFYLLETLVSAFKYAKDPEKVFVGAVVQNCFGSFKEDEDGLEAFDPSGKPCFTGKDIAIPPEKNGIEAFCAMPDYHQFCENGQIRVLYMHHTDGQGPSMARYLSSKLWGGENYFMQIDSHLRFADDWDAKYIKDLKLTLNYPKSVFSSYPPGFEQVRFIPRHMGIDKSKVNNETVIESPGCRLCHCSVPGSGDNRMMIIQQSRAYIGNVTRPLQQPFLGAGLVFAHGNFLKDVPYDPYLPWTFMGEEIVLSMRAWTHGWNMYAPRKNLIIHQYRPAKLGLPRFFSSIKGMFNFRNNFMQNKVNRRMKYLVGYHQHTAEKINKDNQGYVLEEVEKYGMGDERSREDFHKFSQITIDNITGSLVCTKRLAWCMDQTLE